MRHRLHRLQAANSHSIDRFTTSQWSILSIVNSPRHVRFSRYIRNGPDVDATETSVGSRQLERDA